MLFQSEILSFPAAKFALDSVSHYDTMLLYCVENRVRPIHNDGSVREDRPLGLLVHHEVTGLDFRFCNFGAEAKNCLQVNRIGCLQEVRRALPRNVDVWDESERDAHLSDERRAVRTRTLDSCAVVIGSTQPGL